MDRQRMRELMEKLIGTKYGVEALNHMTVLLMDSFRGQGNESGQKLLHCYHTLLLLTEKGMQECINFVDETLMEMRRAEK